MKSVKEISVFWANGCLYLIQSELILHYYMREKGEGLRNIQNTGRWN